ncbi:FGFR1 oncoprotein partner [Halocaridina rubra]|uniref:FGFR1 oncoprotein partner n=1 Tax=Halocaridina rubra TaxID=373956 RepID=A0AAN8X5G6_HALRR
MSLEDEDTSLKDLVTKTLQNNGVLGKIQAQLRASVFLALEEEFREKNVPLVSPAVKQLLSTREGSLAAALVQDFLQSLNLDFSLSVFAPESGHSALWSFPGKDAILEDLRIDTKKDDNRPILLDILRERESPSLVKAVESKIQNGLPSSIFSVKNMRPQSSFNPVDTESDPLQVPKLNKLLTLDLSEQNDTRSDGDREDEKSSSSQYEDGSEKTVTNSKSTEEDNPGGESPIPGVEKQYEEDFSSLSEKECHEEDGGDVEEELEASEDIDEDISDLLSSTSKGSDHTLDQSISQACDVPNYQEDL